MFAEQREIQILYSTNKTTLEFDRLKAADGGIVSLYPFHSRIRFVSFCLTMPKHSITKIVCVKLSNSETDDVLVNNLKLSSSRRNLCLQAEFINYLGVKPIKLDIELYETEGKYLLNFISAGNSCPVLNALFELEVNVDAKERKVEQCLYYRLVNNPDVVLDYKVLQPFEDIIEVDRLIEDSRLVWN